MQRKVYRIPPTQGVGAGIVSRNPLLSDSLTEHEHEWLNKNIIQQKYYKYKY